MTNRKIYKPGFLIDFMTQKIPIREVKKYFILADAGKYLFNRERELGRSELEDSYYGLLYRLNQMEEEEFDERITDKVRLQRYNDMEWFKGEEYFTNMGSWPKMAGLPIEFTTGNIPETAKMLREFKNGRINVSNKLADKTKYCVKKVGSIIRNIDFIYQNFPLILFPGGEVREKDYNNWAKENNEPLCEIYEYDIDDGNNRAVSYALTGLKDAPVYIGARKDLN